MKAVVICIQIESLTKALFQLVDRVQPMRRCIARVSVSFVLFLTILWRRFESVSGYRRGHRRLVIRRLRTVQDTRTIMMAKSGLLAAALLVAFIPVMACSRPEVEVAKCPHAGLVDGWVAAYNRHDLDALLACYGDGIENTQLPWGKRVVGKEAMRAVYAKTFAAFPDIAIRVLAIVCDKDVVVLRWEFCGTMSGDFAGTKPTNKKFQMEGCEMFRIADGKVVEQRGYWDKDTMFRQLGISK